MIATLFWFARAATLTAPVPLLSVIGAKRTLFAKKLGEALQGYEAMNQLRKGQVQGTTKGDMGSQIRFIEAAFGVAA